MLQEATRLCGGQMLGRRCGRCTLESLPRPEHTSQKDGTVFSVFVHVLSASIPVLEPPGMLVQQQPQAEVSLGAQRKEGKYGTFTGLGAATEPTDAADGGQVGPDGDRHHWCFGDTLTMKASLADIRGMGIQLRLLADREVRLGSLQVKIAGAQELGQCSLSLRYRVLPACLDSIDSSSSEGIWESPVVNATLWCPHQKIMSTTADREPSAYVALRFGVSANPRELLRLAKLVVSVVPRIRNPHSCRSESSDSFCVCTGNELCQDQCESRISLGEKPCPRPITRIGVWTDSQEVAECTDLPEKVMWPPRHLVDVSDEGLEIQPTTSPLPLVAEEEPDDDTWSSRVSQQSRSSCSEPLRASAETAPTPGKEETDPWLWSKAPGCNQVASQDQLAHPEPKPELAASSQGSRPPNLGAIRACSDGDISCSTAGLIGDATCEINRAVRQHSF